MSKQELIEKLVKITEGKKFNKNQLEQIRLGLEHELDISIYTNPEFNWGK